MGDTTIAWTDKTHNAWIGCQKVTEQKLHNGKGEDIAEFPEDLHIREFPYTPADHSRAEHQEEQL